MRKIFIALLLLVSFNLVAQQKGLLWKIEKEGYQTSYVFGTIHLQVKEVFSFDSTVYQKINECDQFQGELNMDKVNPMALIAEMPMKNSMTLDSLYSSKEELDTVMAFLKQTLGPQADMMKSIKPLYITMVIAQVTLPQDMPTVLDDHLFKYAKSQGKSVDGLETMQEQIDALNSIPLEEQAQDLLKMVRDYNESGIEKENAEMIKVYTAQDLKKLNDMINEYSTEGENFEEKLLVERNHVMCKRLIEDMKTSKNFIAIGAGHLSGKDGLIPLLKKEGFTLTPVPLTFQGQ